MVHSPQLDRAQHAGGQPALRSPGEIRLPDGPLDERAKEKPQRRRGLSTRGRPAHSPSLPTALGTQSDRLPFEQSDLFSLLAHQLLTPLALIDTAAQRMARRAGEMDPEEIEARAGRIRAASARLSTLAHALLSRAKLGAGPAPLDLQVCRIGEILTRTRDYVHCLQPSRHLLIGAHQVADTFRADPLLIEQAFLVLVCNAMKYSPPDTEIEIAGRTADGFVALSVRDRGMGVPADDLPRIFRPFFRSQNASTFVGTGLGLNLADRIVRLHGGCIDVESQEGLGSTFTIRLPVGSTI